VQGTRSRRLVFARMFSSAVLSQALLSAANFAVGLILIRRSSDLQYGAYILASSAILLIVSLQGAFCSPPLAARIGLLDAAGRADFIGGLRREMHVLMRVVAALAGGVTLASWALQWLDGPTTALVLATIAACYAVLNREYLRLVLFAHRRAQDVLRSDVLFGALTVAGVMVATLTASVAVVSVVMLSLAALASGFALADALRRHEPWTQVNPPPVLREIAPLAAWSTAGAAIHWTFSQGYIYLVAGMLDVAAVAAIAATRLLLMPVNLLSTGIGSLMLPLASNWLQLHGAALLRRRLVAMALGLVVVTLVYFGVLWLARDWVFAVVLKKDPAQRDPLLLLWGALCLVMVVRDQLGYLLAAQGRFQVRTLLTLASAVLALGASYAGMLRWGVSGALLGLLLGESFNLCGVILLAGRGYAAAPGPPGHQRASVD
jgi:O-antigen/teichoic acid export membrane protein